MREFKRHLYRLYLTAGAPSLETVVDAIAGDDTLPGAPGKDTVHRIIGGTRLPGLHDVQAVAAVLARASGAPETDAVVARTQALWIEAKEDPGPPPRTVEDWGPFPLGVRRALADDDGGPDGPTPYIARTHDKALRERLRHAAQGGQAVLALLVGQSSTGKTRAVYEAVRSELPSWPVLVPQSPRDLVGWIATDSIDARTVIWLGEAQRQLTGPSGEKAARALGQLLGSVKPLAVLGTLWPEYARALTSRAAGSTDRHFHARALIEAHRAEIRVPDHLGEALDEVRSTAVRDARVRAALRAAELQSSIERPQVIQQLTGGPALVRRYEAGPGNSFSEIEHALVTAAVDARRLGHASALSRELLAKVVIGYLPTTARVTHDSSSLDTAITSLCSQDAVSLSALIPVRGAPGLGPPDGYHPADYLDQAVRRSRAHLGPPEQLWEAAVAHARTVDDLRALGQAAQDRLCIDQAAQLYRRAIEQGGEGARPALTLLLESTGDRLGAETAAEGSGPAWTALAAAREDALDGEGALACYERAVLAGQEQAWAALARLREETGDRIAADDTAQRAARAGHAGAWLALARLRERAGDVAAARAAYVQAACAGEPWGLMGHARLDAAAGDRAAAESAYREAAASGVGAAYAQLVNLRWEDGDPAGAESAAKQAGQARDAEAWTVLARLRREAGDIEGSVNALTLAAHGGATSALARLARVCEENGDRAGAECHARKAAGQGDAEAWVVLTRLREAAGRHEEADTAARAAARAGETSACTHLVRLREAAGDRVGAERAAVEAAAHGDPEAWAVLARVRERMNDRNGSEHALAQAVEAGSVGVWTAVGWVREQRGDTEGAERAYRAATAVGDVNAWSALARFCEGQGDTRRAAEFYQTAVAAGDAGAWEGLQRLNRGSARPR
ncbi:hypothetical protein ACFWNC_12350 [Streptomyces sp. NPDC058369]|uniref:hypothetical protein n=1 Tax=Streptomyces sp. NPDC058369 TaxID=3346462 RepID=UPI00364F623B